ncbi:MAG TPA: DUF86 domain-containing protein [Bacillales bacterium]
MGNDVLINKIETIERCIKRIQEDYDEDPNNLKNFTIQDAILMNIQRACETSIDLAAYIIARKKLGVPQNSRDVFELLFQADLLDQKITERMKAMVGFRNVAVHDYQKINLSIVQQIIEKHLDDLKKFGQIILKLQ